MARLALVLVVVILYAAGCGDDGDNGTGDVLPPMAVTNLAVAGMNDSSVTLSWTAPGDDCQEGTASVYDVRYSLVLRTNTNWWDTATVQLDSVPTPRDPWEAETLTVSSLAPDTTYYFALKTADEVPNWSGLSNVVSAGVADTVPPGAVGNLWVDKVAADTVSLIWTAPGDDGTLGTASQYDLRFGTTPITAANWDSAAAVVQATGEPIPGVPGARDSIVIDGLDMRRTFYFAVQVLDEAGNRSGISNVASGVTGGVSLSLRRTPDDLVTEFFESAYSHRDSISYEAALDEAYTFHFLQNPKDGFTPDYWNKQVELSIAGRMFSDLPLGGGQRVLGIDLQLIEKSIVVDHTNYPGRPPDETWYKVTTYVDLLVVVEDPSSPWDIINYVVHCDQIWVCRPDPDADSLWTIYKQEDREGIKQRDAGKDRGTEK